MICVLYFSLTSIGLCGESVNLLSHYKVVPEFKSNYKNTIFTPVLDCDIVKGKNIIYCSTFQKAWDEITAYEGETIEIKNNKIVNALNEKYIKPVRNPEDIKNEKIFEEVAKELNITNDDLRSLIVRWGYSSTVENALNILKNKGWKERAYSVRIPKNIEIPETVSNYNLVFIKINDLILPYKKLFIEFIKDYRKKTKLATELIILSYINNIIELYFDVYEAPSMKFNKKNKKVKSFVIPSNLENIYGIDLEPHFHFYYHNVPPDYCFAEEYKKIPLVEPLPEGFIIEFGKTNNRWFRLGLLQFKNCNNLKKVYEQFLKLTHDRQLSLYRKEYYDDPFKYNSYTGLFFPRIYGVQFFRMPIININGCQQVMDVNNKKQKIKGFMGINFNMFAKNILKNSEIKRKEPRYRILMRGHPDSNISQLSQLKTTHKYDIELNSPFFIILYTGNNSNISGPGDQIFFMAYIANDELMIRE